uniref:Histone H1 n=1 Tax=Takifugu rubripes TaxID=31033 RepID=H2S5I1_TAKRU
MGEEAPTQAAPAKAAKKKPTRVKSSGPSISELILKAVSASKERNGVSLAALKKNLAADGYDVEKNNARVKIAVRGLVTKGTLVQTKGTGASGSFRMSKKVAEPKERCCPLLCTTYTADFQNHSDTSPTEPLRNTSPPEPL